MTFSTIASYNVPARHPFRFIIVKGSVVEFSYPPNPESAAIVYSFGNGGGVDGAVNAAAGPQLTVDRNATHSITAQYSEGSAVMTGPNSYGRLNVRYVIHATGGYDSQSLSSAYSSSLKCGKNANIEAIAFCLLSAGRHVDPRSNDDVVKTPMKVFRQFDGYAGLKDIYMCAFTKKQEESLVKHAKDKFPKSWTASLSIWNKFSKYGQMQKSSKDAEKLEAYSNNEQAEGQPVFSGQDTSIVDQSQDMAILDNDGANTSGESRGHMVSNEQHPPLNQNHFTKVNAKGKKNLSKVATYNVPTCHPFRLIIMKGSVIHFSYPPNPQRSAIVNSVTGRAATRAAIGFGGGCNAAVCDAGGPKLVEDRNKLDMQCSAGSAVITGPNSYGRLKVSHVIHAFGAFSDQSLSSAYASALECGERANLEAIAFSLISGGGCLAGRTVDDVVKVGLEVIGRYEGCSSLKAVYMCAYTQAQVDALIKHSNVQFSKITITPRSVWKNFTMLSQIKASNIAPGGNDVEQQGDHNELFANENIAYANEVNREQTSHNQDPPILQNEFTQRALEGNSPRLRAKENSALGIYKIPATHPFHVIIAKGSVAEFSYPSNPQHSAIVNDTDLECLGSGSFNSSVSAAGGRTLLDDRQKMSAMYSDFWNKNVRCPQGSAAMTGPNSYGRLKVPYVIHCCGSQDNASLSAAYSSCLECSKSANIEAIAFSLISAGSDLGSRSLDEVLKIGLNHIQRFDGYVGLKVICMFASTKIEAETLVKVANEILLATSTDSNEYQTAKDVSSLTLTGQTKTIVSRDTVVSSHNLAPEERSTIEAIFMNGDQLSMLDPSTFLNTARQEMTDLPTDIVIHSDHLPSEPGKPAKQNHGCDLIGKRSIDFTNRGFSDDDISMVSQALETSPTIESIHMNGNRLSLLEARFTRSLALNYTLKLLLLDNNQIYEFGAGRLADALMLNRTIEHIHLGRNHIHDGGAERLAEVLHINHTIKSMHLHHNGIGDVGAKSIADAIAVNHGLEIIDLQRNRIGHIGGGSLADALLSNHTVTKLELLHNSIGQTLLQKIDDILAEQRPVSTKKQTSVKSSLFFAKLMALEKDGPDIDEKLEVLSMFITDVHMMKFYYTAVSIFLCSGVLTQETASHHIQRGLHTTSETCCCSGSISFFKLILEKAESDQHIQRIDFHRYDNWAEVNRMENAPFIVNIVDSVKSNTARIEGLEANLEAIDVSLDSIKRGLKRQMKIEATVGFLCAALNAISFGVGGSILDSSIKAMESIIDYSDLVHIQSVAEKWGEGCVKLVENGVQLATDEYAERLLRKAVKEKETLTVISATAAMINAQYLPQPDLTNHENPIEMAFTEKIKAPQPPQQDEQNQFLTKEECQEEVMNWLSLHLPQLQKDDAVRYCDCLIQDGFDSVDMLGDVMEEDLPFMKKAHKRNLIQRMKKSNKVKE